MAFRLNICEIIQKKSRRLSLSEEEIEEFIKGSVDGSVEECQIGAMLMAMYLNGLSDNETFYLTRSLMNSGTLLDWKPEWNNLIVDKHSTGGVGDKVSIVLSPALAACGMKVPMISGRGLGITGGTLDKLQSIPGFNVRCSPAMLADCLESAGCFIAGSNDDFCPGDKVLYNVRDVTATVDNMSLIQASIVSKKAAEGIKVLVVDVKVGKGSNFKNLQEAVLFSENLKSLCRKLDIRVRIILSKMDSPLGCTVGNALEVEEAVDILRGKFHSSLPVYELVVAIGGNLLEMAKKARNVLDGTSMINDALKSGRALDHFYQMLQCQGVEQSVAYELCFGCIKKALPNSVYKTYFKAALKGYVIEIDALLISKICLYLGAGRRRSCDDIDYSVGIRLLHVVGDWVDKSENWLELHHNQEIIDQKIIDDINKSLIVSMQPPNYEVIIKILT